jgi:hypothetical protein
MTNTLKNHRRLFQAEAPLSAATLPALRAELAAQALRMSEAAAPRPEVVLWSFCGASCHPLARPQRLAPWQ